jgi:excisionase family DNA binding protein
VDRSVGLSETQTARLQAVMDKKTERLLVRPAAAALMLSVSRSKLYELLLSGELPHVVIGRVKRIPLQALREIAEKTIDQES